VVVFAGVENNHRVSLVSREDCEVSVGSQDPYGPPFKTGQVVLGLTGGLQDSNSLLSDHLSCFFHQRACHFLHPTEDALSGQHRWGYSIVQAFSQGKVSLLKLTTVLLSAKGVGC
jgi:hypothetical protein